MKRTSSLPTLFLLLALLSTSCQPAETATPVPTPCPTTTALALRSPDALPGSEVEGTAYPTAVPTQPATQTPSPTPAPDYTRGFLDSLPTNPESCHPDKTTDDLGIYIYDLTDHRELVSINADVPFQFASAFKAPVLIYFLESCRQYWDPSSPEWQAYFQDREAARNVDLFVSPEYEQAVAEFVSDPANWKNVGNFFTEHREVVNGAGGAIDTRFFVLDKVYGMIAQSLNLATSDILVFVYENCLEPQQLQIEEQCGGSNAVTTFNAWFDSFSGIEYENGSPRRGLYKWETVIENGADGPHEIKLATFGLRDDCAIQTAKLKCDPAYTTGNAWTSRDFFKFYQSLYNLEDVRLRETAFGLLQLDEPGPARGFLKNMTRNMGAASFSKNGHAFSVNGSINTDAGIVLYKGKAFIVVTLSFNALAPMVTLYGSYDSKDNPVSEAGLIQNLLEQNTVSP